MRYLNSGVVRTELNNARRHEPVEPYVALRVARPSGGLVEVRLTPAEALRAAEELLHAARQAVQ